LPVVRRDDYGAGAAAERARRRVVAVEVADDPAAAVQVEDDGWLRLAARRGRIDAGPDVAGRSRQQPELHADALVARPVLEDAAERHGDARLRPRLGRGALGDRLRTHGGE